MTRRGPSGRNSSRNRQRGNGQVRNNQQSRRDAAKLTKRALNLIALNAPMIFIAGALIMFGKVLHLKDKDPVALAVLFLIVGFVLAQLVRKLLVLSGDWPFLATIALPAVLFLVFGGYISGLKVPGGLELDIREHLEEPPQQRLEDANLDRFATVRNSTSPEDCRAFVNAVVVIEQGKDQSAQNLRQLLQCNKNIRYVVFVDQAYAFLGMVGAAFMTEVLDPSGLNNTRINQLNTNLQIGEGHVARMFPTEFRVDHERDSASIGRLLRRMNEANIEAIAITDRAGRFLAVLEREELLSHLLLSLGGFDQETATPTPSPAATSTPATVRSVSTRPPSTPRSRRGAGTPVALGSPTTGRSR